MKDIKIDDTMKTIADGLERVNTTIEDGLKKVEAAKHQKKLSWREQTWWKIAKAALTGALLAPVLFLACTFTLFVGGFVLVLAIKAASWMFGISI